MALPSSPPLLPEPDLPTAPTFLPLTSASTAPIGALHRKRPLSEHDSLSSDPLFSDTASEDDASRYGEERAKRKKVVRGPWWNVGRRGGHSLRRNMAKKDGVRNVDSGVWMGSDDSQESMDSILSSQQRLRELAVEDVDEEEEAKAPADVVQDAEALASRFIQRCLDDGKETVDLSDLGLAELSNATLRPLHQLIRSSFANFTQPPSEDEFSTLTPSIQLFLSRNRLAALPYELFSLTNIVVLSLRNNDLTEVPSSIARLQNLKELNIAGNRIPYLPWELLDMLYCRSEHRQITVRPNPLLEPTDLSGPSPLPKANFTREMKSEELGRWADTRDTIHRLRQKYGGDDHLTMRGELELRLKLGRMLRIQYLQEASRAGRELKLCREELIYLASSAVRYFGVDGTPTRRTGALQADREDFEAVLDPTANAPTSSGSASAPSLFELALRSLQANFNLYDSLPHMADSGISSTLASAIHRAASNAVEHGNETCSTCGKNFIIARAVWMEYWYHGYSSQTEVTPETVLPFLRKACSWACAKPSEMGEFRC